LPKHKQDVASKLGLTDARRPSAFVMAQLAQAKLLDDSSTLDPSLQLDLEPQL